MLSSACKQRMFQRWTKVIQVWNDMRVSNYRIFYFGWTNPLSNCMGFYFIYFQSIFFLHCPLSFLRMHIDRTILYALAPLATRTVCRSWHIYYFIYLSIYLDRRSRSLPCMRLRKQTEINSHQIQMWVAIFWFRSKLFFLRRHGLRTSHYHGPLESH